MHNNCRKSLPIMLFSENPPPSRISYETVFSYLTETHLDDTVSNYIISLDNFNTCTIFRKDRKSYRGGVMIYFSNIIQVHRRAEYEPVGIECLWIEIVNHTWNFFLHCIYRPPHANNRFWTTIFDGLKINLGKYRNSKK